MLVKVPERVFDEVLRKLKIQVYEYNSRIKEYGIYLKPYHIVYKNGKQYIYIGKYWYKLDKKDGKLKWIYLGKKKPAQYLPDPPAIPDYTIIKDIEGYIIDEKALDEIK
ncbi:hypothetical protein EWF20_03030 [Sulfolobus sp. S-194]|uniref:hypothetical protein n=1 Tax=Sulfolobus sp. S-194 TaxID=2512240 RepID=UPI0014373B90|nr:hypothetical protein [Sulfolobus sp. S-194]QIW23216.1 hypothetical protein EWF20_03030 [Sulfolobus sp. S-194]